VALFALLNFVETIQGAHQAVKALSEVGVAHPQALGIALSAGAALILGLIALGPDRVRRGWCAISGGSRPASGPKPSLPLLDRLWLKIDEAKAVAKQMHEVAPGPTLVPARAWRGEVYEMLRGEKPDCAQRFRDNTEEIPQITDQTFFPARLIFEHQIEQLEALLSNKQH
jgi:hypothetical protein